MENKTKQNIQAHNIRKVLNYNRKMVEIKITIHTAINDGGLKYFYGLKPSHLVK